MSELQRHHSSLKLINEYRWDELTLSDGYPGILLLFSSLNHLGDDYKWTEEVEHHYVIKIKNVLESEGLRSLSLFSGLAGICFAIHHASHGGTRYQKMLNTLHNTLIENTEKFFLNKLEANLSMCRQSLSNLYDLIQGICGIGRYALEHLQKECFQVFVEKIINVLIRLCQPIQIDNVSVPGWYISPEDILNKRNLNQQKGNFNIGLSHGVTGVLAFLSIAYLKGVIVQGQKETILNLSHWLQSKSFIFQKAIRWPQTVSWQEEIESKRPTFNPEINDSWCYGVPGISRSLFLAGKVLEDNRQMNFAVEAFENVFSRSPDERNLPGPALCHGISGLLLTANEMSQDNDGRFDSYIQPLISEIFDSYEVENYFGFSDFEMNTSYKYVPVHKPGLLEGSAGILLALLSYQSKQSKWHLPLLLK